MTAMRDRLSPEAEPLASWMAHETTDDLIPVHYSQKYWSNRLYSLRRRAAEVRSIVLSFFLASCHMRAIKPVPFLVEEFQGILETASGVRRLEVEDCKLDVLIKCPNEAARRWRRF